MSKIERPLSPKAATQISEYRAKLGAAFGQKRSFALDFVVA
jgi:hypothetical protein